MPAIFRWSVLVENGHEYPNTVHYLGEPDPNNPRTLIPFHLLALCYFRDGPLIAKIERTPDGAFSWFVGPDRTRQGVATTFDDALAELPALITHPDHEEVIEGPTLQTASLHDLPTTVVRALLDLVEEEPPAPRMDREQLAELRAHTWEPAPPPDLYHDPFWEPTPPNNDDWELE